MIVVMHIHSLLCFISLTVCFFIVLIAPVEASTTGPIDTMNISAVPVAVKQPPQRETTDLQLMQVTICTHTRHCHYIMHFNKTQGHLKHMNEVLLIS